MSIKNIFIQIETSEDHLAVYEINKLAFDGRDEEPRLVEAM
jgi:hypothetical protein